MKGSVGACLERNRISSGRDVQLHLQPREQDGDRQSQGRRGEQALPRVRRHQEHSEQTERRS